MALPVVAWFLIFCYGPMWGVMIAFKDFKPLLGFADSDWVGFKHFIDFSQDPIFGESSRIRPAECMGNRVWIYGTDHPGLAAE